MTVPQTCVDLAETGYLVTKRARKDKSGFRPYVVLKGKLGARKATNSYLRLIYRGNPQVAQRHPEMTQRRDEVMEAMGFKQKNVRINGSKPLKGYVRGSAETELLAKFHEGEWRVYTPEEWEEVARRREGYDRAC
jgi:hypothetical protein